MKFLKLALLLSVTSMGLVACSSTSSDQPGTSTPTAAPASSNTATPAKTETPTAPAARMIPVPAGMNLEIVLTDALSSAKNKSGDPFTGSLAVPLVVGGKPALERGTKVHGRVVDAKESGRVKGLASLTLTLTDVVQDGKTIPVVTKNWSAEADSTKKRDAGIIGGAAGVGAAIGAIAGGKKGAAEGAAIGGGAGTGTVLVTKGKEVELGSETKLKFTLDKAIELAAK